MSRGDEGNIDPLLTKIVKILQNHYLLRKLFLSIIALTSNSIDINKLSIAKYLLVDAVPVDSDFQLLNKLQGEGLNHTIRCQSWSCLLIIEI